MSSARQHLLVTGAHGFVAGSVLAQAGPDWELHAMSRGEPLLRGPRITWHQCDPSDPAALAAVFRESKPAAVIHAAALADIDFCQSNPGPARRVNVDLTRSLATLCSNAGARLVFCSTDTVFDGERAPYREQDPTGAVNLYAETKVQAEEIVLGLGPRAVVARLALVVGLPVLGAGNSFLARLAASLKAGREVAVPAREVRTPIDVLTAGRALLELAHGRLHGCIHLAGNDRLNRLELTRRIAVRLGLSAERVVDAAPAPGRAARPRDVSLDNTLARQRLTTPMLAFDDGLSLVFSARHSHGA
jgi:dTDP-4-dehydrorhamnose reductase